MYTDNRLAFAVVTGEAGDAAGPERPFRLPVACYDVRARHRRRS